MQIRLQAVFATPSSGAQRKNLQLLLLLLIIKLLESVSEMPYVKNKLVEMPQIVYRVFYHYFQ